MQNAIKWANKAVINRDSKLQEKAQISLHASILMECTQARMQVGNKASEKARKQIARMCTRMVAGMHTSRVQECM